MAFQSVDQKLFYKSPKANDPRLGDEVKPMSTEEATSLPESWLIAGYPDDEGVGLNFGKKGAAGGPHAIRNMLYRLSLRNKQREIFDIGDFESSTDLAKKHENIKEILQKLYLKHRILSFGGGHDYAYPDVAAFLESLPEGEEALVINVDAHLDVRQPTPEPHSGTPFYRLLEEYSNFQLVQFGYQAQANSLIHEEYCRNKKVILIPYEDRGSVLSRLAEFLQDSSRPCFLSIDIDGFSSTLAPGASAAWPIGLQWNDFEPLFLRILENVNLRAAGLYEVAPNLDDSDKTSKLAASIAYRILCEV